MKQKFTMPDGEVIEKDMPTWKTPYNHDTNFESDRTALFCEDESLTQQQFKDETDINIILQRFTRTGELPPIVLPEHFMDTTTQPTFKEMNERLAEASAMFYELPASKRAEFLNDPTRWADAVVKATESGNANALASLGIDLSQEMQQAEARRAQAADAGTPTGGTSSTGNTPPTPPGSSTQGTPPETPKK